MRFLKLGLVLSFLLVVSSTAWVIQNNKAKDVTLPIYGTFESFELVNQDNGSFRSESLLGSVSVVNFIFTSCPHVCPMLTRQMAKIQEETKDKSDQVRLVSISVDPEHDTPKRLNEYGKKYGADFSRWSFLTGPTEILSKVVINSFKNAMGEDQKSEKAPTDLFEITHGENFVILDKRGNLRAFRQAKSEREVQAIIKIIDQLNAEPSPGFVVSRLGNSGR